MVSLINFKIVNEELRNQQQFPVDSYNNESRNNNNDPNEQMFIEVLKQQPNSRAQAQIASTNLHGNNDKQQTGKLVTSQQQQQLALISQNAQQEAAANEKSYRTSILFNQPPNLHNQDNSSSQQLKQLEAPNFVVTWRNLRFAIEPKWHQKIVKNVASPRGDHQQPQNDATSSISRLPAIEAPAADSIGTSQTKIVLDKLDGSFRSGELTAILGPSGAGKTTLLDCLTGRRKHGLSGSIRISSSSNRASANNNSSSNNNGKSHFAADHFMAAASRRLHTTNGGSGDTEKHPPTQLYHQHQQTGDNLKVSIIPQNDHLMGHLTVYETLNYASKMKNCFNKEFDHKINIKRVAQQLGLMSCLETRINKLSGGQYKRVSIAQELLSSPDILILDEPTSGLDAMTCYQTVQVLRKLTDDRRSSGQNQIAVILTIHQPNSDVFQQFNHVYVVAQGGKCIYEGSPANIESVINRVGIRLPNSYYNPATMIVEIAAAKFGLEAIQKLNGIQKKQYDFVHLDHEQNSSTGDSAVDCHSSSSSLSSSNDDDDEEANDINGHVSSNLARQQQQDDNNNCPRLPIGEINNNFGRQPPSPVAAAAIISQQHNVASNKETTDDNIGGGLVNKGFVMEAENNTSDQSADSTVNFNNNGDQIANGRDSVIVEVPPTAKLGDLERDPIGKLKNMTTGNELMLLESADNRQQQRCKKRRRTRKRSGDLPPSTRHLSPSDQNSSLRQVTTACARYTAPAGAGQVAASSGGGGDGNQPGKRLKLNSLKADQRFPFWRHTYLHFHRSWLSIVRDPMLCSMQLALHIIVPVMVSLVYGTGVGKPNACPRAGPMDIMAYALEPTDSALQLQEDLRTTLENIGYIFFKLYGIIFAAMTVTVLTFPLDMHVLVKEFRNGWYGLSSYFLGRTLADIPFQLTLPLLAMSLSYYATGQPYSYLQWRFLSITAILILSSLIAQSQGLLFGAILMDKMKAAVFVAPAATTPIILFAGFLVRTQSIPRYLRPLSNLSYLRYAIEACLISRYGFNQCECDPAIFNQTVPELPPIARSMLDYWLSSFKLPASDSTSGGSIGSNSSASDAEALEAATTTVSSSASGNPDLFTKLIDSLAKANSFGRNITSCEQVVPYPMIDYDLKDSQLFNCFAILLFMLIFTRLLTFFIVCFKVKRRV